MGSHKNSTTIVTSETTGCPKKMVIRKGFEFLTLGGVFLGVKNNSKNFGNKKNISWGWFESEANEEAESGRGNSLIYDKHVEDQLERIVINT